MSGLVRLEALLKTCSNANAFLASFAPLRLSLSSSLPLLPGYIRQTADYAGQAATFPKPPP